MVNIEANLKLAFDSEQDALDFKKGLIALSKKYRAVGQASIRTQTDEEIDI